MHSPPPPIADAPEPSAQGTFAKTPLSHVLLYALDEKLTGTIEFSLRTGLAATVLFIEGLPTKARTTLLDYYLGRALVDRGFLTEEQHAALLPRLLMSEQLHGEALVRKGVISTEQLRGGLEAQLLAQLRSLAELPPETVFKYFDGFDALASYGSDADVRLDPYPVIWTSLRAQPPWDHIQPVLTGVGNLALRLVSTADTARFLFDRSQLETVALLRQRPHRLHELSEESTMASREVLVLVYCLIVTKQVAAISGSSAEGSVPPSAPDPEMVDPPLDSAPVTPVVTATVPPVTPVVDLPSASERGHADELAPQSDRPTAPPPPGHALPAKEIHERFVRSTLPSAAVDDVHTRTTVPQMTALTPSEIAAYVAQQEALTKSKHGAAAVEVVAPRDAKPPFDPASSRKTPEIGTVTLQDIDEAFADEEKK